MASNKVNLGIGLATGMFYTAPAGTSLPAYPSASLSDWTEIGAVTSDGITWSTGKDSEPLRNWAKEIERLVGSDEGGTVQAPLMYTVADTLKLIFGSGNVTETAATATNGNITSVTVAPGVSSAPAAFLFLMKDGDARIVIAVPDGQITEVGEVTFASNAAVGWNVTLSCYPDSSGESIYVMTDDGAVTSASTT